MKPSPDAGKGRKVCVKMAAKPAYLEYQAHYRQWAQLARGDNEDHLCSPVETRREDAATRMMLINAARAILRLRDKRRCRTAPYETVRTLASRAELLARGGEAWHQRQEQEKAPRRQRRQKRKFAACKEIKAVNKVAMQPSEEGSPVRKTTFHLRGSSLQVP